MRPLRAVAARNGADRATLSGAAGGGGHLSGSRAGVEAIRGRQRAERQPVERAAPRQYRARGSLRGRRYPQLRVDRARREGSGDVVGLRRGVDRSAHRAAGEIAARRRSRHPPRNKTALIYY